MLLAVLTSIEDRGVTLPASVLSGRNRAGARRVPARPDRTKRAKANLSDARIPPADLGGADLRNARLGGANVDLRKSGKGPRFQVYIGSADLPGVNLFKAVLVLAKLIDANLHDAELIWVDFSYADCTGADFSGADLSRADFSGTDLGHAKNLTRKQTDSPDH